MQPRAETFVTKTIYDQEAIGSLWEFTDNL